jgi:hypothetical protein
MTRVALAAAFLACAAGLAAGQPAPAPDPVAALLARLEQVVRDGPPERYLDLLTPDADREKATAFALGAVSAGATRVVVRERDRFALVGGGPREGQSVLLEVFVEFGAKARLSTWRLDVRPLKPDPAGEWGIVSQEALSTLQGLFRLSLNPKRQIAVRDLVVSGEDLRLVVPEGLAFVAEAEGGPTAIVLLGRGDMTFSPAPKAERGQLRLVTGAEALQTTFETAFIRLHPSDVSARLAAREMSDRPVDPKEFKRAEEVFRQELAKSFGLDLGDLSGDMWSLFPSAGDFLAEIRTRRFDTLTYTQSGSEVEDISLYDRKSRRNLSVYSSRAHLAQFTRFWSEDDRADYVVKNYELDVAINPQRRYIEGRGRLAIETRTAGMSSLTLRLAEGLAVQSVVSKEFGRLLCVRIRNQNGLVVNLPSTLIRGFKLNLVITYAGTVPPQPIDRETVDSLDRGWQDVEENEIPLEESFLYSNRSYWYPQPMTPGYSTATLRLLVPEPYSCVASGEPVSVTPAPGPAQRGFRMKQYAFAVVQPVRYLSCLIARLTDARNEKLQLRDLVDLTRATRKPGPVVHELDLSVKTNPRQKGRGREIARQTAAIVKFYTSLVGDFPYPALTVAAVERQLPGGHSPGYLAVVAAPGPGATLRWTDDPGALPGFPEFFLAHELAHQWWGQAVGWKNYHEQWLSEGFAQYFAALYAEKSRGRPTFDTIVRRMQDWATAQSDQGPIYLGYRIGHVKGDSRLFRAVVYNKGALVLHMLRRLVGDQAFFAGLRRFYDTWRFQKAGSDDLRQAMEAESGMALGRFFEQWVYGEGLPQVSYTWRAEEGGAEAVVRLEQAGDVFDFPVTVTLDYLDRPPAQVVVKVTDRAVEARLALAGRLRKIDVNRDGAVLGNFRPAGPGSDPGGPIPAVISSGPYGHRHPDD